MVSPRVADSPGISQFAPVSLYCPIMKGVIVAAGYGTRFLPVTKTIPKEMLPLITKPSIDFIVEELLASGITEILFITSRRKKAIEDYFDREVELESVFRAAGEQKKLDAISPAKASFFFVRQAEMKGTGNALLLANLSPAMSRLSSHTPMTFTSVKSPSPCSSSRRGSGPAARCLQRCMTPRTSTATASYRLRRMGST